MNSILSLKNVSYVYSPKTPFEKIALNSVSVEFEKGSMQQSADAASLSMRMHTTDLRSILTVSVQVWKTALHARQQLKNWK